jgi:D-threo-aldose 1-dehydrogenase
MTVPLPRRNVGRTGLSVTALGLGGAPLGDLFAVLDEAHALATIERAFDSGIGLFDTAPQYGHGLSEHRFGHVLRRKPRDAFVLSTKVGRLLKPTPADKVQRGGFKNSLNFAIVHDYTYDATMRSIDDSYQRLGMDRIDIALIHDVDVRHQQDQYEAKFREAIGGACRALDNLRRSGVVKAIGIGINEIEPCVRFAKEFALDAYMLAGRYTLLEHTGLDELLSLAGKQGFSLLIAGPFNSGILATGARAGAKYNYRAATPEALERVRRLEAICARHDTPLAAAAIQFPLAHPRVAAVVTGAVEPSEIAANADLVRRPIPSDLWAELRRERLIDDAMPAPSDN